MGKTNRRYVAEPVAGTGWRIVHRKRKAYWGQIYVERPDALIDELNGEKRPDVLTEIERQYAKMKFSGPVR